MFRRNIIKRRKSNRLKDYNYSKDGHYFVTICTKNRINYFGKIENGKIVLSRIGRVVNYCWQKIPEHFPDVELDEYIVMPNHVHGIVILPSVEDRHACPLQKKRQYQKLPVVIGSFKSSVTKKINQIQNKKIFAWQKSYYDHIIRNEESLNKIREYIIYNPSKWTEDRNNIENYTNK